jgi:hypothetical protein
MKIYIKIQIYPLYLHVPYQPRVTKNILDRKFRNFSMGLQTLSGLARTRLCRPNGSQTVTVRYLGSEILQTCFTQNSTLINTI